jgi:DNA-binding response OmpR family regulator
MAGHRSVANSGPLVLSIDDDRVTLNVRQWFLENAGFRVVSALSGEQALNQFSSENFDMVISDERLPGRSGSEIAAEMKRLKPLVPVVLVTGASEALRGSNHADLVIVKGTQPDEFLAQIRELLAKHSE